MHVGKRIVELAISGREATNRFVATDMGASLNTLTRRVSEETDGRH